MLHAMQGALRHRGDVIPAYAGIQIRGAAWIPACARMTTTHRWPFMPYGPDTRQKEVRQIAGEEPSHQIVEGFLAPWRRMQGFPWREQARFKARGSRRLEEYFKYGGGVNHDYGWVVGYFGPLPVSPISQLERPVQAAKHRAPPYSGARRRG